MNKNPRVTGNELYYLDENGKKQDADIHNEILDNPAADRKARQVSRELLLAMGLSEETIDKAIGSE